MPSWSDEVQHIKQDCCGDHQQQQTKKQEENNILKFVLFICLE